VATDVTPTRVLLTERVHTAAALAAGRGRAAFETELAKVGVAYAANEASTGRMNGYRFADPAHQDGVGEPVWFKASQLDKTLSWAALNKRLSDPPLPVGQEPGKRRLQTRAAHERDLAAAHDTARTGRNRDADRAREPAHAQLHGTEHRWTRTWTQRGPATPAKTTQDRVRTAAGISPIAGDTHNPAALSTTVEQRRRDRLTALVTQRPAPTIEPGRERPDTSPSPGRLPPSFDRDQGRGR